MSNAYETGSQKIIPAVLLYAFHQDRVLMLHRNLKSNDHHEGKWNGLGGKVESGENFLAAAVREFEEESGVRTLPQQWNWMGQLHFPNFKAHKNEDWWVNVYAINLEDAQAKTAAEHSSTEGTLHWIESSKILELNLWDGDRNFIPYVLKGELFQGTLFYREGHCTQSEVTPLSSR